MFQKIFKIVFEAVVLAFIGALIVELYKPAISYLPAACFLFLAYMTWELGVTGRAPAVASQWKKKTRGRSVISYVVVAIVGALLFSLYWFGLSTFLTPKIKAHTSEEARPYLRISLVIDSIQNGFVNSHFLLENKSSKEIRVRGLFYRTPNMQALEGMEIPRLIPPNDHMPSNAMVVEGSFQGNIRVTAVYEIDKQSPRTVKVGFAIRPVDLYPHVLDAATREEFDGRLIEDATSNVLQGLTQPIGSVMSWIPEKNSDGSPNSFVLVAGADRQLIFDPISRFVHLTMSSGGRVVELQRPFGEAKEGMQSVAVTWDDKGDVHLYVAGHE